MDIITIITSIVSLIGGGAVASIVTLSATRKRANAEAESVKVGNNRQEIENLRAVIDELQDNIVGFHAQLTDKDARITELSNTIYTLQKGLADKRCENTTKGYYMCVHQGCALRKPVLGRGKEYYIAHEHDVDFGADFTTAEELLKLYHENELK